MLCREHKWWEEQLCLGCPCSQMWVRRAHNSSSQQEPLCRLSTSLGRAVWLQPGEAETISHSAVIPVWLDRCAWGNANTLVLSSVSTVLTTSVHFPSPAPGLSMSAAGVTGSASHHRVMDHLVRALSYRGQCPEGSCFSNLPLKQ